MKSWILGAEAEECRLLAVDLEGREEEPFLLRLASAFDDLHVQGASIIQAVEKTQQTLRATVHFPTKAANSVVAAFHPFLPLA
jgi:hypothetical protein